MGRLWIPEPAPTKHDRPEIILTGRGGIAVGTEKDGYYPGRLLIRRDGIEVRLRITDVEFGKLCEMDIMEWT